MNDKIEKLMNELKTELRKEIQDLNTRITLRITDKQYESLIGKIKDYPNFITLKILDDLELKFIITTVRRSRRSKFDINPKCEIIISGCDEM